MSFSCRIRQHFCASTIRIEHMFFNQQTIYQIRTCAKAFPNEFTVRSDEYCMCQQWNFTGYKRIKQRRISFVLDYLRMILWKISTAISIKHRILATFNLKKINSDSLYAFNLVYMYVIQNIKILFYPWKSFFTFQMDILKQYSSESMCI